MVSIGSDFLTHWKAVFFDCLSAGQLLSLPSTLGTALPSISLAIPPIPPFQPISNTPPESIIGHSFSLISSSPPSSQPPSPSLSFSSHTPPHQTPTTPTKTPITFPAIELLLKSSWIFREAVGAGNTGAALLPIEIFTSPAQVKAGHHLAAVVC
jgi:hypothetical protein